MCWPLRISNHNQQRNACLLIPTIVLIQLCASTSMTVFDTKQQGAEVHRSIRVGQSQSFHLPHNFSHYAALEIPSAYPTKDNQDTEHRKLCYAVMPGIRIKELAYQPLYDTHRPRDIIIDFKDLVTSQEVLDVYLLNGLIYVAMSEGSIKVFKADSKLVAGSMANVSSMQIEGYNEISPLVSGSFVEVEQWLLFVSGELVVEVQLNKLTKVEGYIPTSMFESVDFQQNVGLLGVVQGSEGLSLYTLVPIKGGVKLERVAFFGALQFKSTIYLSDIVGYEGSLFALDRDSGLFQIVLKKTAIQESLIEPVPRLLRKKGCENLLRQDNNLFVSCPQIIRIDITTNLSYTYKKSGFHIKNLIVHGELLVASGDNLIKIFRNEVLIAYYQEFHLDKIAVSGQLMVIATEMGIAYFNWTFTEPEVICGLELVGNREVKGTYETTIKVWAECQKTYLQSVLDVKYEESMTEMECLYHFPLKIELWQGRFLDLGVLKVTFAIVLLGILIILVFACLARRKIQQLTFTILKYTKPNEPGQPGNIRYNDLVQQKHESVIAGVLSVTEKPLDISRDHQAVLQKHDIE